MSQDTVKIGVVGATGYTGIELLRLLLRHPHVELAMVTSRAEAGKPLTDLWPSLRGASQLAFVEPDAGQLAQRCDMVFFATPHAVAMNMVRPLLEQGVVVIDLSADFRLNDIECWEQWYGVTHSCPDLVDDAVYGLPELFREDIRGAQLIACPGCYPTAIQLGFAPLLEKGLVDPSTLIANAASGVSGAGRQAKIGNLYAEVGENFKAYGVGGHRHLPEIEQGLARVASTPVNVTFVPHLLPMIRGIHATLYCRPIGGHVDYQALYAERYAAEPFVDVLDAGIYPQTASVRGTNICQLSVQPVPDSDMLVVLAVEDNLTKGAAGQAIQIMNILGGWDETDGLCDIAIAP